MLRCSVEDTAKQICVVVADHLFKRIEAVFVFNLEVRPMFEKKI